MRSRVLPTESARVFTKHPDQAGVRGQSTRHQPNCGRLARSAGPDDANDAALGYLEGDVLKGGNVAEPLTHLFEADCHAWANIVGPAKETLTPPELRDWPGCLGGRLCDQRRGGLD